MTNRNLDPELVERVVREVLRRLLDCGVVITSDSQVTRGGELQVAETVVATAALDGKLNGVRRVVVGSRAFVTPSAKDELRDRGIKLVRR